MTKLIIAGAKYFNGESILIPHYTGKFWMVDCDEYATREDILSRYDKKYFKENKDNYIEHDGVNYYYAEYSPFTVTEDWELLSDLSDLRYNDF